MNDDKFTTLRISVKIRKKITEYLKLKYSNNDDAINVNEQNEIELIINLGLLRANQSLHSNETTILHNGKLPRKDVLARLGFLASEFLQCHTYPIIPAKYLYDIINKALGDATDWRVKRDYRQTILRSCHINDGIIDYCHDSRLGDLDVSFFVQQIPKQYIIPPTATSSSFVEENP